MIGKADMLLANRTLSAAVVVCLVISAFAGFLLMVVPTPKAQAAAIGDLTVIGGTYTIQNIEQPVDGNVVVGTNGVLVVRDATLSVISNYGQTHTITVGSQGTLILDHGTITSYLDQINPWPKLDLTVQNGGHLMASGNSVLMFPGNLILSNGAHVILNDTVVEGLPSSAVTQYVVGSSGLITFDSADDGPAISLTDSTLELFDSSISKLPEYPSDAMPASNLTLSGSSVLLAVNSYVGIDFGPAKTTSQWYVHNVMVLSGRSHAYLYGTWFEPYAGLLADRAPAIVATGSSTSPALPLTKGPADNTLQSLTSLAAIDSDTYQVTSAHIMEIETWDVGGLADGLTVSSASLLVTYTADPAYIGSNAIQWARDGTPYADTTIVPRGSDPIGTNAVFDIPLASVPTVGDVRNFDVRFANSGGAPVQFDRMWIVFTVGSDAFVYRWLNVTVGDEYGVPIEDANVTAKFTGASNLEGQPAIYYTPSGVSAVPPIEVLTYLGESGTSYHKTKADGKAVVPYLTDILTDVASPNGVFVGSYAITGSVTLTTKYESTESFSFPAYPAMDPADRSFAVTVEVTGVSAPSPDPARWLVVPRNQTIRDMTYYHAGDIIVAANGTLEVKNAVLQIVQAFGNQRTIYVDGTNAQPGILLLDHSSLISDMPLNIIVKGYGVLDVRDSSLAGASVIALEHASVLFKNATMDQKITTAWDSNAVIDVKDSTLDQTPTLSGNSEGSFTNISVPSIEVQDSAEALIYRWIHVTVYDGAGMPLPGANVSAYYYLSYPRVLAGYALTSKDPGSLGVAKVNALGSRITALGSTFVGNYIVNASYQFPPGGAHYYADSEVSVGVMPYTTPLGKNATYATMHIRKALPDLFVGDYAMGFRPVTTDPTSPVKAQIVTVHARINNTGVVRAYNVQVEFYDDAYNVGGTDQSWLFQTVTVPVIEPGTSVVVNATWTASYPLGQAQRLFVIADRLDIIPEINNAAPATGYGYVTVQSLPDVVVTVGPQGARNIYASSAYPEIDVVTSLNARVYNKGDQLATDVTVEFWDNGLSGTLIGSSLISISPDPNGNSFEVASVDWTPSTVAPHVIFVRAIYSGTELDALNNNDSVVITVYDHPDLQMMSIGMSPSGTVSGGGTVTVWGQIFNLRPTPPFLEPKLRLDVSGSGITPIVSQRTLSGIVLGYTNQSMTFTAPVLKQNSVLTVMLTVNPDHLPVESGYGNNFLTMQITVLDVRPDLSVTANSIKPSHIADSFGHQVVVKVVVDNLGGTPVDSFEAMVGLRTANGAYNSTNLDRQTALHVNASHNVTFSFTWTIGLTAYGPYQIWVRADPNATIDESNRSNNFAYTNFTINKLSIASPDIVPAATEYKAGTILTVSATIMFNGTQVTIQLLPGIQFWLIDSSTKARITDPTNVTSTDQTGGVFGRMMIPTDTASGNYQIVMNITDVGTFTGATQIHVSALGGKPLLPTWLWLAIIVAAVAAVAGFMGWTYKYGLGKLVECGECGQFIPAASKRCPKCGVEFEVGTMKCSECGAWIPAESKECPNCGVKFVGETEGEADYLDRMKKEYDEMVGKYRELAKGELGKKFSEKDFDEWWKRQPGYISFDDWLAKEEEKKKEGPVPCPVCGTLNPKEATVCHKCGTVFGVQKEGPKKGAPPSEGAEPREEAGVGEQPSQQPMPVAPKMVIRRPIDRKVVPKKIIKSPMGGTEGGTEEKEEQQ